MYKLLVVLVLRVWTVLLSEIPLQQVIMHQQSVHVLCTIFGGSKAQWESDVLLVCDVEKRVYYDHYIKGPQALKLINSQFENSDS